MEDSIKEFFVRTESFVLKAYNLPKITKIKFLFGGVVAMSALCWSYKLREKIAEMKDLHYAEATFTSERMDRLRTRIEKLESTRD